MKKFHHGGGMTFISRWRVNSLVSYFFLGNENSRFFYPFFFFGGGGSILLLFFSNVFLFVKFSISVYIGFLTLWLVNRTQAISELPCVLPYKELDA